LVFAPVQEFSFVRSSPETGGTQSFGFISPGFQIVSPHVKFEGLYQIAVITIIYNVVEGKESFEKANSEDQNYACN